MGALKGIFAASVTPLKSDFFPDLEAIPGYLDFLAQRGCHGALIMGTTGEGPSFSHKQRAAILQSAIKIREEWPDFLLLAGTGAPSLDQTVQLTRHAFDLGMDGAVVLPPYYFRAPGDPGLLTWFSEVISRSVPEGGNFLLYHIPGITRISISIELLSRLLDFYPRIVLGIKDSSGNSDFAEQLGNRFGNDLMVFTGNDRLLSLALTHQASGSITAMGNLISPQLRLLWEAFESDQPTEAIQGRINKVREMAEMYSPFPPLIKYLLNQSFEFPLWPVCPPLEDLPLDTAKQVSTLFDLA